MEMKTLQRLRFYTLAGVSGAQLQGDTVTIVQKNPLPEFRGAQNGTFCSEFANWANDAEGVLRFTRRYGALNAPLVSGAEYSFLIGEWQREQLRIRSAWDMTQYIFKEFRLHRHGDPQQEVVRVEEGEEFVRRSGTLEYKTRSLYRLIWMQLVSFPQERLLICCRPDCSTRYFIATHLRQKYCSDLCAHWAQRGWKREWWKKHGDDWRRRRTTERDS